MSILKKVAFLCILITSFSCDDGDFEKLDFQFTKNIYKCGEYLLYKTNSKGTETLILSLDKTLFNETVGEETYSVGNNISVVYRLFDKKISNDYFCQDIPPATPKIIKNLKASSKTQIVITTTEIKDQEGSYEYEIVLKNLLFEDDDNFYFETFNFGVFTP